MRAMEGHLNGLGGVIDLVWTGSEEKWRTVVALFTPRGMIWTIISLASKFWWTEQYHRKEHSLPSHPNTFLCSLSPEDRKILFLFDFHLFYWNSNPFPLLCSLHEGRKSIALFFNIAIV